MIVEYPDVSKTTLRAIKIIHRGGNGLKTSKLHEMLQLCDNIKRHGTPLNYDGLRGKVLER